MELLTLALVAFAMAVLAWKGSQHPNRFLGWLMIGIALIGLIFIIFGAFNWLRA